MNEVVTQTPEVDKELIENIDRLILLTTVEGAYREQSDNWFKDLGDQVITHAENTDLFFSQYEATYKEKTGEKQMPSTYRSAKSVLKNAIKNGVHLHDLSGDQRGKTALEKATRDARKKATGGQTNFQKACSKLQGAIDLIQDGSFTDSEKNTLKDYISFVLEKVDEADEIPF